MGLQSCRVSAQNIVDQFVRELLMFHEVTHVLDGLCPELNSRDTIQALAAQPVRGQVALQLL